MIFRVGRVGEGLLLQTEIVGSKTSEFSDTGMYLLLF